jgi:hypothetical protein
MKIEGYLKNIVYILLIITLVYNCDPTDARLRIVNDSTLGIYYFYSCDSSLNDLHIFRRNIYKDDRDGKYIQSHQFIEEKSFRNVGERGFNAWIHFFDDCKGNKIHIYIFADSIVSNYSDIEIKYQKLYIKHFRYTLTELERNNWTIIYP